MLVAGLDVGRESVRAWVTELDRPGVLAGAMLPLSTLRPSSVQVEVDPVALEQTCRAALTQAVADAGRPAMDYLGVTVGTVRQAFVLVDRAGAALGNGVLDEDRRGAPYVSVLEGRYQLTGHWGAPELTLPKLLAVEREEPERWAATARVLFLHDWLLWRMCGEQATEGSYASAGGMADVTRRRWATELLDEVGIRSSRLAPWVEAGAIVGELGPGWGLPETLPVVAGSGDAQLAAMSAGGLGEGVFCVLADPRTTVLAATSAPVVDPVGRPWISTHAARGLWVAETDAGPASSAQEQAFSVRRALEELERALGSRASAIVTTGDDGRLSQALAEVLGRDIHWDPAGFPSAAAGTVLVAKALGAHAHAPGLPEDFAPAGDPAQWQAAYERWAT